MTSLASIEIQFARIIALKTKIKWRFNQSLIISNSSIVHLFVPYFVYRTFMLLILCVWAQRQRTVFGVPLFFFFLSSSPSFLVILLRCFVAGNGNDSLKFYSIFWTWIAFHTWRRYSLLLQSLMLSLWTCMFVCVWAFVRACMRQFQWIKKIVFSRTWITSALVMLVFSELVKIDSSHIRNPK